MDRKKLEKNIASNLTIDLDVEKYIEITLLDIEQYANQRVIEELNGMLISNQLVQCNLSANDQLDGLIADVEERIRQLEELKQ
jgi:hypothetical protein